MWKKQDDAVGAQPDFASKQRPDLASLGDALVESLVNDQFKKGNLAVVPQKVLTEDHHQPLSSSTMTTYIGAVNEFTENATALIEQLPLLSQARGAYEEAMRASAETRKFLDAGEETLRTLMTQLEQGVSIQPVEPAPDKKNPEPAKVERMRGTDQGGGRAHRWP
jgi:exonuclease VII small subunit